MRLIVQKYGGSSVASPERIRSVARRVAQQRARGVELVVVVSAMGSSTDALLDLARAVGPTGSGSRERDQLLATGEQVAAALLALALVELGVPAVSLTGEQAGILTDGCHGSARIRQIRVGRVRHALAQGQVPIVTGFQGMGPDGSVCTLGRGGSDTSAVALAVALAAERCDIFTDVAGMFTADPRRVPTARLHAHLTHHEAHLLAVGGAVVLHPRAAAMAAAYRMPLRILSSLEPETGSHTHIEGDPTMEGPRLLGVTVTESVVHLVVELPRTTEATAAEVLCALTAAGLSVHSLSQALQPGSVRFSVRVAAADAAAACRVAGEALGMDACISLQHRLARICLVGSALDGSPSILQAALGALIPAGIAVEAVEATEVGLTFYVDPSCVGTAVRVLHDRLLADPERDAPDAAFGSDGDGADTPLLSHAKGAK